MAKKSQRSEHSLVIVESPAKAKTINRYLGSDYTVMASMGHVRDLPENDLGIDLENQFEPVYEILPSRRKIVDGLKKAAKKAGSVYLATDLDREGEAIAWHLLHALELDESYTRRVVFNEITKSAIQHAFANPQSLNMDKVNAQQARRLLDRIVGYQLSPLLQMKIGRGLSAGRVQSVSVRLIVDREQEIRIFVPEESWKITACFSALSKNTEVLASQWNRIRPKKDAPLGAAGDTDDKENAGASADSAGQKERNRWLSDNGCLVATLVKIDGKEFHTADANHARTVAEALGYIVESVQQEDWEAYKAKSLKRVVLVGRLDPSRSPEFAVKEIQRRRTTSKPNPPFTTATLQQAASSALGFAPSRTMRIAQQLYEGVELGSEGQVGLITYMRTDSTNLSADSVSAARHWITTKFGDTYVPQTPQVYGNQKRAQEAHEAVRPTEVDRTPESVKSRVTAEQFRLYELIWRRFVACQMSPAQWDASTVLIRTTIPLGEALFRASGRTLVFDGFLRLPGTWESDQPTLPTLETNARLSPIELTPAQMYTSPPPRYTEASLIKKMEAEGIGRPSTYASIIQTVQDRGYVDLRERKLHPTARGEVVTTKLVEHFPKVMDVKFTSHMEEELDKIEESHLEWVQVLEEFYGPFRESLDRAHVGMQAARAEASEFACTKCGKPLVYRLGRNGRFLSCTGYPDCKTSLSVDDQGRPIDEVVAKEPCISCGKSMVLKTSRLGPFLGCSGYPDCTQTLPCDETGTPLRKVQPEEIVVDCSECNSPMTVRFARGKSFLGCTAYPKCKASQPVPPGVYIEKPKAEKAGVRCEKCGRDMVIRSSRRGPFLSCGGFPRCRNAMPMDKIEHLRTLEAAGQIPEAPKESALKGAKGRGARGKSTGSSAKTVDVAALGSPPKGFAWTRTGRPVVEVWPEDTLSCPNCSGEMLLKNGRFGHYFGCPKYPKCSFVANLRGIAKKRAEEEMPAPAKPKPIPTEIPCEECGAPMLIRTGRTGPFLGCSKYPKCRTTKPLSQGELAEATAAIKA